MLKPVIVAVKTRYLHLFTCGYHPYKRPSRWASHFPSSLYHPGGVFLRATYLSFSRYAFEHPCYTLPVGVPASCHFGASLRQ